MGNINLLITPSTAQNITALINCPSSTVKEVSKVPTYALAYLAKGLGLPDNDTDEFYLEVISSLKYEFPNTPFEESLLGKRSFTVDKEYLEAVRQFIIRHDSSIKRPKSSYVIRLAIAYTLMCFEEGKTEATSVIAPTIDEFELLEDILALLKESATSNDPKSLKKLKKIKELLKE